MVLSKRERYIAIGTVAAVAILGLDYFVFSPLKRMHDQIVVDGAQVTQDQTAANNLFTRQRNLKKVWTEMQQGGLKVDPSEAESQAYHAVLNWADAAGVDLTALKSERTSQEGKFQVISFHVTATGPLRAISRLLWSTETAAIPVRITDMQVIPRKEGTDDLSVQLSISTLCLLPDESKSNASVSSAAGGEVQP